MIYIFYAVFLFFCVIHEGFCISSTNQIIKWKNKAPIKENEDYSEMVIFELSGMGYLITSVVGLLSSQWIFFLVIVLISLFSMLTKSFRYKHIWFIKIDSAICMLIGIALVVNKIHLHWRLF